MMGALSRRGLYRSVQRAHTWDVQAVMARYWRRRRHVWLDRAWGGVLILCAVVLMVALALGSEPAVPLGEVVEAPCTESGFPVPADVRCW
jgi:hypothetical protein